jgi:hypothetical protein
MASPGGEGGVTVDLADLGHLLPEVGERRLVRWRLSVSCTPVAKHGLELGALPGVLRSETVDWSESGRL